MSKLGMEGGGACAVINGTCPMYSSSGKDVKDVRIFMLRLEGFKICTDNLSAPSNEETVRFILPS